MVSPVFNKNNVSCSDLISSNKLLKEKYQGLEKNYIELYAECCILNDIIHTIEMTKCMKMLCFYYSIRGAILSRFR